MQRFEITVDGVVQPGDFATQAEADAAAKNARSDHGGKSVLVRPRGAAAAAAATNGAKLDVQGHPQGPASPADATVTGQAPVVPQAAQKR